MDILNQCTKAFRGPKSSEDCDPRDYRVKQSLNYVWINKKPFDSRENELCGVPLKYLDKAIENANRYPDAQVNIWLDFNLLDASSLFFVSSHGYIFADKPSNIAFRNLHEIRSYTRNPIFNPERDRFQNVWARVDYARLLVLRHVLADDRVRDAFYSDFDVDDVKIENNHLVQCMEKFGLIFGAHKRGGRENGFLGIRANEPTGFLQKLIKDTLKMARDGEDGFGVYTCAVYDWERKAGASQYDAQHKVLDECGKVLPDNALYMETAINALRHYR